ncbi:hypothetical protein GCM10009681_25390 [Luedemannella helvata]|uniref:Uncharacterized protein n=1 Tax=Luedemannella helvata TaxID=349315 RepID=A0ABN2KD95_9ACTN
MRIGALTSETSESYATADGQIEATMAAGPVRVRSEQGWLPVDLTLVRQADGSVAAKAHPRDLKLSGPQAGSGEHELAAVGSGDERVSMSWTGELPQPVLEGSKATYADALPGVDLVVQATRTGFQQLLVVKDRAALAKVRTVTLPVTAKAAADYTRDAGGNVALKDKSGKVFARVPAPQMWDSSLVGEDKLRDRRVIATTVTERAAKSNGKPGFELKLTPDATWLDDPARVFPITIDPTINPLYTTFDTYVKEGESVDRGGENDLQLGVVGGAITRALVRWNTEDLRLTRITSATSYFWNWWSPSCTAKSWDMWTTSQNVEGMVWSTQPTWLTKESSSTGTKGYSSSCNDGWVSVPSTSFFQKAADNNQTRGYMGLRATSETDSNSFKQFRSRNAADQSQVPYSVVTYNSIPSIGSRSTTPSTACVTGSGRPYINTGTPKLSAVATDPEGSSVMAEFEWQTTGGTAVGSSTTSAQASGKKHTVTIGSALTNGSSYRWRVRAKDTTTTGTWSAWCEFTVDTTAPSAMPGVSSTDYADGVWSGAQPLYTYTTESKAYIPGTTTTGVTGDEGLQQINLGFTMPYYGRPVSSVWVESNGQVHFSSISTPNSTVCYDVPDTTAPNDTLNVFCDDLVVDGSASVRTATGGTAPNRYMVIDWHNVLRFGTTSERLDAEAILYENGDITVNYANLSNANERGAYAMVGLENATGTLGTQYLHHEAKLLDGTAITFRPETDIYSYTTPTATQAFTSGSTVLSGLAGSAGDDKYQAITLPFPFSFYNRTYTTAHVNTNGFVTFTDPGAGANAPLCTDIPSSTGPNNAINVFCDDLITDASSSVRWAVLGSAPDRQVVIEWNNVLRYNTTDRISAEVFLSEGSNDITFAYNGISTTSDTEKGSNATVGIENPWSNQASKFLYHQALLTNSTVIRYHPQPQVLISPGAFTFTAGGMTDVASYQYDLDTNPPATTVAADGLGGSATVTINPPSDGAHTLYVRSVDRAGNVSATRSYQVNLGYGGILSPEEGDISAAKASLSVAGSTAATGVTYQWRRADTDAWVTIPAADVTLATGGTITWPLAATTPGTFPKLNWNIEATLAAVDTQSIPRDGPLQLRAIFNTGPTSSVKIRFDRNQASAASADMGLGSVNLLTGNLSVGGADVSVRSYGSDLTVSRTYNSRQAGATDPANMFGPGWVSSAVASDSGAPYTGLQVYGSLVQVGLPDGGTVGFTQTTGASATNRTYTAETGSEGLTLTYAVSGDTYTLRDIDGNTVTFTHVAGAAAELYNPTTVTEPGSGQSTAISWEKVSVGGVGVVRPTRLLAPVPAGVTCTTLVRGCRALTFTYASTTTATGTTQAAWGDYAGRASQISFTAWNPDTSPPAMATVVMSRYAYDTNGRLRQQWDPRLDWSDNSTTPSTVRHLDMVYDYDADGVMTAARPSGQQPWQFSYTTLPSDPGKGRLATISRSALTAGTATTTVVYKVPTSGANSPWNMSASQTTRWGQNEPPTDATAVFPPTQLPGGSQAAGTLPTDYARATTTYMDANGRQVNTVDPAGATTATWFDRFGNSTRNITPGNIRRALDASASDTAAQEAATALRESSVDVYAADGTRLLESFGPERDVVLPDGSLVRGRTHGAFTYDQGAPASGGPFHLVTKETVSVQYLGAGGTLIDADTRTTTTSYDWTLRQPVISTIDPSGLALATRTTFDAVTGLPTSVTSPAGGTSTNTPATMSTVYYRTGSGSGYSECDNRPEWANLVCRTQSGGQPASGPELQASLSTYDMFDQIRTTTEKTSAGTLRTTTITYDGAGRPTTFDVVGAAGTGTPVPTTRIVYDPSTGMEVGQQSVSAGTVVAQLTRTFDSLGRLTAYVDADNNTTTLTYDLLSRVGVANDGKSTSTFTYDSGSDRRGLPSSVVDGQAGTFSNITYNVDGQLVGQTWPDGMTLGVEYDEVGARKAITFTKPGCGSGDCVLFAENVSSSVHDQKRFRSSTLSAQGYAYDASGRLETVLDAVAGQCVTRVYGFNVASDRTALTQYPPTGQGDCQSATSPTARTYTYDSRDAVTTAGTVYDSLGRTVTTAAADTMLQGSGDATMTYSVNDMIRSISQGDRTTTYTLDVRTNRFRSWVEASSSGTITKTNHYASNGDSPAWTDEGDGTYSRPINAPAGIAGNRSGTGAIEWYLTNSHGDIVGTVIPGTAGIAATFETDEFGVARSATDVGEQRYGWSGVAQRSGDTPAGFVLMGVRVYNPATGRFLQVDPVSGGSSNRYDYVGQDPVNQTDIGGMFKCACGDFPGHKVYRGLKVWSSPWTYGAWGSFSAWFELEYSRMSASEKAMNRYAVIPGADLDAIYSKIRKRFIYRKSCEVLSLTYVNYANKTQVTWRVSKERSEERASRYKLHYYWFTPWTHEDHDFWVYRNFDQRSHGPWYSYHLSTVITYV